MLNLNLIGLINFQNWIIPSPTIIININIFTGLISLVDNDIRSSCIEIKFLIFNKIIKICFA